MVPKESIYGDMEKNHSRSCALSKKIATKAHIGTCACTHTHPHTHIVSSFIVIIMISVNEFLSTESDALVPIQAIGHF